MEKTHASSPEDWLTVNFQILEPIPNDLTGNSWKNVYQLLGGDSFQER